MTEGVLCLDHVICINVVALVDQLDIPLFMLLIALIKRSSSISLAHVSGCISSAWMRNSCAMPSEKNMITFARHGSGIQLESGERFNF